jgi:CTP synthase
MIEGIGHPFMLAAQFHPEFKSRPNRPHPMFDGFIKALA